MPSWTAARPRFGLPLGPPSSSALDGALLLLRPVRDAHLTGGLLCSSSLTFHSWVMSLLAAIVIQAVSLSTPTHPAAMSRSSLPSGAVRLCCSSLPDAVVALCLLLPIDAVMVRFLACLPTTSCLIESCSTIGLMMGQSC